MKHALYAIEERAADFIVLHDTGHDRGHPTITNDAEHVVAELYAEGHLPNGRKLLYYDSEERLTELLHEEGRFAGFLFPENIAAAAGEVC